MLGIVKFYNGQLHPIYSSSGCNLRRDYFPLFFVVYICNNIVIKSLNDEQFITENLFNALKASTSDIIFIKLVGLKGEY